MSREPEQIRGEIERAREELGDTVAAVAEKTDVKQQAQAKTEELKERARQLAEENQTLLILAGLLLLGLVLRRLLSR